MEQAISSNSGTGGLLRPSTEYQSPVSGRNKNSDNYTQKDLPRSQGRSLHTVSLRFMLINILAFGLLGLAWFNGLVDKILIADSTRLTLLIFAVFIGGLILCGYRAFQIGADLSDVEHGRIDRAGLAARIVEQTSQSDHSDSINAVRMELTQRIVLVRYIANTLVLLGLIGTVVGFIIALSSIDPERAKDVEAIAPMVTGLISGMSTALYTTLVGAVLNLWLMANYQVLAHGTVRLISRMIDMGQRRA